MRKTTLTYSIAIVMLLVRGVALFFRDREETMDIISAIDGNEGAGSPSGQDGRLQDLGDPASLEERIEEQRGELPVEEDSDLIKAANKLAQQDYSTTSLNVNQGTYDIQLLQELYKESSSDGLAALLLQYYRQELLFDDARAILEQHPDLLPNQLSRQGAIQLFANTSAISVAQPQSIQQLSQKVSERRSQQRLSAQDQQRYQGLISLWQGDVDAFVINVQSVQDQYYAATKQAVLYNDNYAKGQKDVPAYYRQALFGLSLLQNQYVTVAEKVALDVVSQDDNYILPYQLLAYTTFLQRDRIQSTDYIRELLARDHQQRPVYQFMLGVVAFWQEKHQQAILYFIGVDDEELNVDTRRYLSLSYAAIGDTPQAVAMFERLLASGDLTASDYYHYFYTTYFSPYRSNTSYAVLEENRTLALRYHQLCKRQLDEQWQYVCDYGEVGQLLLNKQYEVALRRLLYLVKYYPQSYLFEALGDYYQQQGRTQDAIVYYLQAIRYTKDTIESIDARRKIEQLLQGQ